jgi:hypothetical protein
MFSVIAIGPNVRGLIPGRGDEFVSALKIRSTPSVGEELKPSSPCKILRNVKKKKSV